MKRSLWYLLSIGILAFAVCGCGNGNGNNTGVFGSGSVSGGGGGGSSGGGGVPVGAFTLTGRMAVSRQGHTATLLADGKVLVAGGKNSTGVLASTEIFDSASGAFSVTGSMVTPRVDHAASLLKSGKVLLTGGADANGNSLTTAEIFDPATNSFALTGSMATGRIGHTTTLLNDGRVLMAGGGTATAEIFDPQSGIFTRVGNMIASRSFHTATLLSSGDVLIAGGTDSNGISSGDLFDLATLTFTSTSTGGTVNLHGAAALLSDHSVLLTGGEATVPIGRCLSGGPVSFATAILFDSNSASFSETGDMSAARSRHTATVLSGGEVLVAGGAAVSTQCVATTAVTTVQPLASAELFNPTSRSFAHTGNMNTARAGHTATSLGNGKVLLVGGTDANGNTLASGELFQ